MATAAKRRTTGNGKTKVALPGQVVLVLQGGGALGAYQVGVYQALHEAGIEPDWVIGTSIGAINAALIAGNAPAERLDRLREFWSRVEQRAGADLVPAWNGLANGYANVPANWATMWQGIPAFFAPNPFAWLGLHTALGVERAAYYSTEPLRETLAELVDCERLGQRQTRLTVGAVNVRNGEMRYFDSRDETLGLDHILASGALPPAFPAVRIQGDPYWDGGIYSNTPIEAVLDDRPRRDSLIFTVHMWNPQGTEPESLWQVMGRQKDIQYASRARSHIARQKQIHHLRHIIRELAKHVPEAQRNSARRCTSRVWSHRGSTARTRRRTSTSHRPASMHAGRRATRTRGAFSPARRGRSRSMRWKAWSSMTSRPPLRARSPRVWTASPAGLAERRSGGRRYFPLRKGR